MEENYNHGSQWVKCDLHVHTPYSIDHHYGNGQTEEVWEKFISDLESLPKEFKIIGINDYLFIEGYEKVLDYKKDGRLRNIELVLPVIEFRVDKFGSVSKDNPFKRVNYHVIFSDELEPELIRQQFLNALSAEYKVYADYESNAGDWNGVVTKENLIYLGEKLKESSNGALTGSALKIGFQSLNIPYTELKKKLDNVHLNGKYLTAVGKTEWDSMRWEGSPADKKSVINAVDFVFVASDNPEAFHKSKNSLVAQSVNDLLLDCSDAHSYSTETHIKDRIGNCQTWVKINPTFRGLKYLLYEPKDRIHIGATPEVQLRVRNNPTLYIKEIIIDQVEGYNGSKGIWFKQQVVRPSKELTAIIGNKGKGKSAITDIIGLLGNSHNFEYFSFLNNKKFRKNGLARNFEAKLIWENGHSTLLNLNDEVDSDLEEKVKYLPQRYFEELCNEIENNENFKKEINQVVFTHLDETERLGQPTFEDFIELKKESAEAAIEGLRQKLSEINEELINLQTKGTDEYLKSLGSRIETIESEIESHIKNQPTNPFPEEEGTEENDSEEKGENFLKLQQATSDLSELNGEREKLLGELTNLNSEITALGQLRDRLASERTRVNEFRQEEAEVLQSFNISLDDIYPAPNFNFVPIDQALSDKEKTKLIADIQLGRVSYNGEEHGGLIPKVDEILITKIAIKESEIEALSATLDAKEKAMESYKNELIQWERVLGEKMGDLQNPTPGTLNYFKSELKFITEELDGIIEEKKKNREEVTADIYTKKKSIVDIYSHFKSNIDKKLSENMAEIEEYEISLEASMQIRNFTVNFLDFIDKNRAGTFRGQEIADATVKEAVQGTDPNTLESIMEFLRDLTLKLEYDNGVKQNPFKQIKESKELKDLYDYLFGLKYLDEKYELKFAGKSIEQLSPGERGAALIVFYLLLDKDEKPLIIDQPEDNLDNQSVYEILVPFIRQAKKKRQLMIVTHNPNLAVVADAEQVIHVELDKKNNNTFSFESGGIENPRINKGILDILEGTKPAFDKRKMKYLTGNNS
ncbi:TrlF family AAA-like ATPase [Flagellimonas oceanensis]|uniref:TrlF family AAA-like ATPase n=1 Tax=Flagellimonas oceanensis TaxID=2499163 RepID=UPI000F8D449D|nr:hypothetical protein [Allomuricauda oceanensis]